MGSGSQQGWNVALVDQDFHLNSFERSTTNDQSRAIRESAICGMGG
jgi:hypothetical protein